MVVIGVYSSFPLKNRMPKSSPIANFGHPVSNPV